ncbi:MAG: SurA N-terminal domain-containing protein [Reinekea sp.]
MAAYQLIRAPVTVNGDDISAAEYQRLLNIRQQELASQYGVELATQLANSDILKNDVIESLVRQKIQTQLASELNMAVSDDQVSDAFANTEAFQVDGKFDKDTYLNVLSANGYTHQSFLAEQKTREALMQMESGIANSAFVVKAMADRYQALGRQVRSVQFKQFNAVDFRSEVEISDDELNEYYTEHQAQYMSDEQIQVNYLLITLDDLAKEQLVSDEDVQSAYDSYLTEVGESETREISHILFADGDKEAEANAALERLNAGESFADLATELSDDPGSAEFGGSLGALLPDVYVPEFYDAAMALTEAGQISGLVETQYGIHLIRLDSLDAVEPDSLDDKRDELVAELKRKKAQDEILLLKTQVADEAFAADNIASVADTFAVEVQQSDLFGRTGGKGYFAEPDVVSAAFTSEVVDDGLISNVVKLSDGSILAMQKADYQPEEIQPLEDVIDSVREALTTQKATELMTAAIETELAEHNTDADGWSDTVDVQRTSTDVPSVVRNKAFELPKPAEGKKSIAATTGEDTAYLVAVTDVFEAENDETNSDTSIAKQEQAAGAYQNQMFYNIARNAADVKVRNF